MKKAVFILTMLVFGVAAADAQFPIKIPKITVPKVEPKPNQTPQPKVSIQTEKSESSVASSNNINRQSSNRQMVMDDGFTFFDAEAVKEYDSKISLEKDIGWYLKSNLRILGTFPKRSAFKVSVKKNGKELSNIRCEGSVYTKADDTSLRTPQLRKGKDLNYEDFMTAGLRCFDEKAVVKEIGEMDVEIYFIDGDSNSETLVRKHKIDVRKAAKVRGNASPPQPDVLDYYIQRHAEAAVAIAYFVQSNSDGGSYFGKPIETFASPSFRTLNIHTTFSPAEQTRMPSSPFVQCSVNGQKINLQNDKAIVSKAGRREYGIYTDRIGAKYKTGPAYKDTVEFIGLNFNLPLYFGEGQYAKPTMKIENFQGKWECAVIENGVTFRTFRWEVGAKGIIPHAEQKNGNVNLFYDAALIEMEIPSGGSPIDFRLLPLPNAGLFYGTPWTTAEGKAMAGRVPKLGNPYHVPSAK